MAPRSIAPALLAALLALAGDAGAEEARPASAAFDAELSALARGPAPALVPDELDRARALVARAREAEATGNSRAAEALLGIVPLQLRLIRELLRAAELEEEAATAERQSLEAERRAREARVVLDRLLERLVALSIGDPFE